MDYDKDTKIATLKTADGESIVNFVDKDEYTGFKSQFINFVNAEYLPFKNNVYTQFTISTQNALSELDNRVDGLRQQLETVSANIPDVSNKADKDELFSGSYNDLTDKPSIPTVPTNVSAFTNDAGYMTSADVENIVNSHGGEITTNTNIEACSEDAFNQLEANGAVQNDICYFIFK